ncbi:MAG: hypothetical protein IIC91_13455 [Chloroflexi bacterium]|nr:hypothetical protein [Chloroflexota bacterium]
MYSAVFLVLHDSGLLDDIIKAWREAGAPAITILDSVGTREIEDKGSLDDLPLMPSIKDLIQADDAPRKTMFAIIKNDMVDAVIQATEATLGDLTEKDRGILMVIELAKVVGYRGS